jgi:hypothetical protein
MAADDDAFDEYFSIVSWHEFDCNRTHTRTHARLTITEAYAK